jgi:hypothetical protein
MVVYIVYNIDDLCGSGGIEEVFSNKQSAQSFIDDQPARDRWMLEIQEWTVED